MARVEGIDPKVASLMMRFFVFRRIRKIFGKDLTAQKIAARVPRVFWVNVISEILLGQKAKVSKRQRSIVQLRTAARVGCPF